MADREQVDASPEAMTNGEDVTAEEVAVGSGNGSPGEEESDGLMEAAPTAGEVSDEAAADEALETLRAELAVVNDRHLRLAAEFDNYRKRVERERTEAYGRAQAALAARLLDTLDDLERVSEHSDTTNADALLDGVRLVEKKLQQALEASGLKRVEAEGEIFDPNTMEAIATVPTENPEEEDVVADVFQAGYLFKGLLIRPARVRVKKHEG